MNELQIEILKEEENSGRIFATGKVDGNSVRFYIDTGSSSTKVKTNEVFDRYTSLESKSIIGISGKPIDLSKINIQNITMGPFSILNHQILRYPNSPEFESTVGIDLIQNKIVGFEFTKSKITELDSVDTDSHFTVGPNGYILIDANISGAKMSGIWDTGAGLTTIDSGFVKKNATLFEFVKELDANDPTGNGFKMKLYTIKKIRIGSLNFDNVQVLAYDFSAIRAKFNDQSINMAIGFNLMIHNDWYFNMKNHTWFVK